ncbi:MAG TPA: biotin--[acetyl-CoA-carboxylase] ligase, partial [Longimicrobium sp.]
GGGGGGGGMGGASAPGLGIWLSVVLRPADLTLPGLLPILVGLAGAEALDPYVRPARVQLKWPNDLLLAERKLAGILCESAWEGERTPAVVAGIGVNVNHVPGDFPPELRDVATSVRIAAGWEPPRADIAGALVARIVRLAGDPPAQLPGAAMEALTSRDLLAGRSVEVTGATTLTGTALGISPGGALLVRTESGALRTVRSGTVRFGPAPATAQPGE